MIACDICICICMLCFSKYTYWTEPTDLFPFIFLSVCLSILFICLTLCLYVYLHVVNYSLAPLDRPGQKYDQNQKYVAISTFCNDILQHDVIVFCTVWRSNKYKKIIDAPYIFLLYNTTIHTYLHTYATWGNKYR